MNIPGSIPTLLGAPVLVLAALHCCSGDFKTPSTATLQSWEFLLMLFAMCTHTSMELDLSHQLTRGKADGCSGRMLMQDFNSLSATWVLTFALTLPILRWRYGNRFLLGRRCYSYSVCLTKDWYTVDIASARTCAFLCMLCFLLYFLGTQLGGRRVLGCRRTSSSASCFLCV